MNEFFASAIPRLHRAASRLLRNPEDSEDAMQDTLLSAFQNLGQFEGRAQFSTWIHSILLNTIRARARKQKSRPETLSIEAEFPEPEQKRFVAALIDTHCSPEQECAGEEESRIAAEIFQSLPAPYQTVIRLCDLQELGREEAAAQLGLPVGTVKCQLHRARRMLTSRARRAISGCRNSSATPPRELRSLREDSGSAQAS